MGAKIRYRRFSPHKRAQQQLHKLTLPSEIRTCKQRDPKIHSLINLLTASDLILPSSSECLTSPPRLLRTPASELLQTGLSDMPRSSRTHNSSRLRITRPNRPLLVHQFLSR